MTAEHPPPRPSPPFPRNRTVGVAGPDLVQLRVLRQRFRDETGLRYTIPMTVHRIITEWISDHE
jgi:hypothetical protein